MVSYTKAENKNVGYWGYWDEQKGKHKNKNKNNTLGTGTRRSKKGHL